ncbi:hypothetical protein AMEX_G21149 [Astyanax mexicanus]|uniref:Mitochondrial fission factor n=1 Tax=Astyanax mexicanus TaxID=7994 RepID=A0A8T2KZA8_ASTMX|nr:hypothetical protein AMEX_G21149 [Astyanax mexicanus]
MRSVTTHCRTEMNEAAFPSPTMEMAEMNRIHYELEYTEGISQRMRIPEMLKVAPLAGQEQDASMAQEVLHTVMMHVPDRIVVAGQLKIFECVQKEYQAQATAYAHIVMLMLKLFIVLFLNEFILSG